MAPKRLLKWPWKREGRGVCDPPAAEKSGDGYPERSARASPAAPSQDVRPPEHAAPTTSALVQQTISDAPLPPVETSPKPGEPPATESTNRQPPGLSTSQRLWNAAYDNLKKGDDTSGLVTAYVKTLTKALEAEREIPSDADVTAELEDPTKRQMFMRERVEKGRAKVDKASNISKRVGDFVDAVLVVKPMVDLVIQNIPHAAPAALPWAGVCVGLQILSNPAKATKANLAGITHVISRMDWYCALTEHLLNEDSIEMGHKSHKLVLQQLEEKVVTLYEALLLYQMKSVCSYYQHQGYVFLRGLASLDKWDADLTTVTDAEDSLQRDSDQYNKLHTKEILGELVTHAAEMERSLGDIRQDIRDFTDQHKAMQMDAKDKKCLQDLYVVDPQDDMEKIEKNKDTLLDEAYKWILDTKEYAAFTDWSTAGSASRPCRLMWVKGHAGAGKTMLLMGIIRELSSQPAALAPNVSHFFCQGTYKALNNATAILRSLVWLLLVQQPHLISHLRSKHENAGSSLFEDTGAFIALSNAFKSMLKDRAFSPAYFVVDALDECEHGLADLVKLISTSLTLSHKVKWLVSSRPSVELRTPDTVGSLVELDAQKLEEPVNAYIDHKLSTLTTRNGYNERIFAMLAEEVRQRAQNTFLWVALAFKELDKEDENLNPVHGSYALGIIRDMPPGLSELYDSMMTRIERGMHKDPQYCKNVLAAATLAQRPPSLSELAVLAGLPPDMPPRTVVKKCGSFLISKEETVSLIHQSAKDYLDKNFTSRLEPAGVGQEHADIGRRSIDAMSSMLYRNIYKLSGFEVENMRPTDPDPLAPIRYSCVFWADHLCFRNGKSPECRRELTDDGAIWSFFKKHFLHWLEAVSLLGSLSQGIAAISKLHTLLVGHTAAPTPIPLCLLHARHLICNSVIRN
ncbi:hypothetical protein GE09DRAFT_405345 [Coniochaeta sp. 2T2.1]|nr:hypothetical protein GE09DRAFT_405345 [Coniochaeta sp. 2T2.1]